jgi:hypothetical protein
MGIDWAVIVDKVPEIIVVLVFSGFTLKMLKEFRVYLTGQNERWRAHTAERDAVYLAGIADLSDKQSSGVEAVSKDIRAQTAVMTKMCDQMETDGKLLEFIAEDVKTRQIRGD